MEYNIIDMNKNNNNQQQRPNPFQNNPFVNGPMGQGMPQRTNTGLRIAMVLLLGVLPFLIAIFTIGTDDVTWRFGLPVSVSYGEMWGIGFLILFLTIIVTNLLVKLTKSIHLDVLILTWGLSVTMMMVYLIPLEGWWAMIFIIILPIVFIVGTVFGAINAMLLTIGQMKSDANRAIESMTPEQKRELEELQRRMQSGEPLDPNMFGPKQEPKPKEPKEEQPEHNPYVDVEDEED